MAVTPQPVSYSLMQLDAPCSFKTLSLRLTLARLSLTTWNLHGRFAQVGLLLQCDKRNNQNQPQNSLDEFSCVHIKNIFLLYFEATI